MGVHHGGECLWALLYQCTNTFSTCSIARKEGVAGSIVVGKYLEHLVHFLCQVHLYNSVNGVMLHKNMVSNDWGMYAYIRMSRLLGCGCVVGGGMACEWHACDVGMK